jgi:hypothetical protein
LSPESSVSLSAVAGGVGCAGAPAGGKAAAFPGDASAVEEGALASEATGGSAPSAERPKKMPTSSRQRPTFDDIALDAIMLRTM